MTRICRIFKGDDVALHAGAVPSDVRRVYVAYGEMGAARDNPVLYPTSSMGVANLPAPPGGWIWTC